MTSSTLAQPEKIYANGLTKKEYEKKYWLANKEKINSMARHRYQGNKEKINSRAANYRKTREGVTTQIYYTQISSSRQRGHQAPNYTSDELRAWAFSQDCFEQIYQNWKLSGFSRMKRPSFDRLDDYKPYTLDNIQIITWGENLAKACSDRKSGINCKVFKSVFQLTLEGVFFAEHKSTRLAANEVSVDKSGIGKCCRGVQKSAGGFVWCYA